MKYPLSKQGEDWLNTSILMAIATGVGVIFVVPFSFVSFSQENYPQTLTYLGLLILGVFSAIYCYWKSISEDKKAYEEENTPFIKWYKELQFDKWSIDFKSKLVDNYSELTGEVEPYLGVEDFMSDLIVCQSYFPTTVKKDGKYYINSEDRGRIVLMNKIRMNANYIAYTRKNNQSLTEEILKNYEETFNLLGEFNNSIIVLSLEDLVIVNRLVEIIKEDVGLTLSPSGIPLQHSKQEDHQLSKRIQEHLSVLEQKN